VSPQPKRTEFEVTLDREGVLCAEGETLPLEEAWTPEHLVLAALARCSLTSLAYHARRGRLELEASAHSVGAVGRREDGSWGFLEIECRVEAELEPAPAGDELPTLLERAERGCFVGASLRPKPTYSWQVNGEHVP